MSALFTAEDGAPRCRWCGGAPDFLAYHDEEWGFPVDDDRRLFEKLSLELFQSGLSWRTILAKRPHFRAAFLEFDYPLIARFTPADVERLLHDQGIVRHRGKIEAVVNNAQRLEELVAREGAFAAFIWRFEPAAAESSEPQSAAATAASVALAKALKREGWKFVGPTTVYAFMQAMGLINDHAVGCVTRAAAERARSCFVRPTVTEGGRAGGSGCAKS